MGTSFRRSVLWDRLGGQALVMIVPWYPKATLVRKNNPEIVSLKDCAHSPEHLWDGK